MTRPSARFQARSTSRGNPYSFNGISETFSGHALNFMKVMLLDNVLRANTGRKMPSSPWPGAANVQITFAPSPLGVKCWKTNAGRWFGGWEGLVS